MRIVFMGTPAFAVTCGEAVRAAGHEIAAVVTVPDRPAGRGLQPKGSAVKHWALEHQLPLIQPEKLRDPAFVDAMRVIAPDVMVVVAFRILPRDVYAIPSHGAFNLHASLLPKFRGAAPIQWAIINGERETGVTTFFLQDHVDTGAMILQHAIPIGEDETAGELHDRLARLGADAVVETLAHIAAGTAAAVAQNDALASPAPKITTGTCRIEWANDASAVHNRVRGLAPAPGAWTMLRGTLLKIHRTARCDRRAALPPGTCTIDHGDLFVHCGDEQVQILELQLAGRARTSGAQFVQGRGIDDGVILGQTT